MAKSKVKPMPLIVAAALGFVGAAGLQTAYIRDFYAKNYLSDLGIAQDLGPDQMVMQLLGFREFVASILWVRADSFFDDGNYDAVLPIIQVCTVLDPKQIDIFSTGMWHIAYNFTDEEQRSDRRYIPSALALGKVGSQQNPNTYELFFETGWIWYHKIDDDYHQSVRWFSAAQERTDMQQARKNLLANANLRNNQVREALATYAELLAQAQKNVDDNPGERMNHQIRDTIEGNLDTLLVRMVQRGWLATERKDPAVTSYDTFPPFDVGFSARATVEDARVVSIVGTWNVAPVGTRIRVILRDADMPDTVAGGLNWDMNSKIDLNIDREKTFMQDQLFVRNRRFRKRIDMSRDPTMYPVSERSQKYVLEFYYSPRSAPPHIQDKFGFNGEGFTDSNFLNGSVRSNKKWEPASKDKQGHTSEWKLVDLGGDNKVMFTTLELTRDQLLRRGEWRNKAPSVSTKNFDPSKVANVDEGVIQVPTLRSNQ